MYETLFRFDIFIARCLGDSFFTRHSVVFRDRILCHPLKGVPMNEGAKEEHPLKRHYSTVIGSSDVKMVADRHRHAAYCIASTGDELLMTVNIDDLD